MDDSNLSTPFIEPVHNQFTDDVNDVVQGTSLPHTPNALRAKSGRPTRVCSKRKTKIKQTAGRVNKRGQKEYVNEYERQMWLKKFDGVKGAKKPSINCVHLKGNSLCDAQSLTQQDANAFFASFYRHKTKVAQDAWLVQYMRVEPASKKKRAGRKHLTEEELAQKFKITYFVPKVSGELICVCSKTYHDILNVSHHRKQNLAAYWFKHGQVKPENRGGHNHQGEDMVANRQKVHNHIKSTIAEVETLWSERKKHRASRDSAGQSLPYDLNIHRMYKMFLDSHPDSADVKYSFYYKIFNKEFGVGAVLFEDGFAQSIKQPVLLPGRKMNQASPVFASKTSDKIISEEEKADVKSEPEDRTDALTVVEGPLDNEFFENEDCSMDNLLNADVPSNSDQPDACEAEEMLCFSCRISVVKRWKLLKLFGGFDKDDTFLDYLLSQEETRQNGSTIINAKPLGDEPPVPGDELTGSPTANSPLVDSNSDEEFIPPAKSRKMNRRKKVTTGKSKEKSSGKRLQLFKNVLGVKDEIKSNEDQAYINDMNEFLDIKIDVRNDNASLSKEDLISLLRKPGQNAKKRKPRWSHLEELDKIAENVLKTDQRAKTKRKCSFNSLKSDERFETSENIASSNDEVDDASDAGYTESKSTKKLKNVPANLESAKNGENKKYEKVYVCPVCASSFADESEVGSHLRSHMNSLKDSDGKCFMCKEFDCSSLGDDDVIIHVMLHLGIAWRCDGCQKCFTIPVHFRSHNCGESGNQLMADDLSADSGYYWYRLGDDLKYTYQCKTCGLRYIQTRFHFLKLHLTTHKKVMQYVCNICGKQFYHPHNFRHHEKFAHPGTPMKCNICGAQVCNTKYRSHLVTHREKKVCDVCGRAFHRQEALKCHMKVHRTDPVKQFSCQYCGKMFNQKYNKDDHERLHTREEKYFCKFCGKGFVQRTQHSKHVKRHKDELAKSGKDVDGVSSSLLLQV